MPLFCPNCQTTAAGTARCPVCAGRLVSPSEADAANGQADFASALPVVKPTNLGRIIIGLLVAASALIAFRDLVHGLLLLDPDSLDTFSPSRNVVMGIAFLAVLLGGLIAGSGRPNGTITGGAVGLLLGVGLTILFKQSNVREALTPTECAFVIGLMVVAGLAGLVGQRIWPPAIEIPTSTVRSRGSSVARLVAAASEPTRIVAQTHRVRIAVAVIMLILGMSYAEHAQNWIKDASRGSLNFGSPANASIMTAAFALALVAAAGLTAGATTRAGARHGFLTGFIGVLAIVVSIRIGNTNITSSATSILELIGLSPDLANSQTVFVFASIITILSTLAGSFGAGLLPPLAPVRKIRSMD